jgi:hypothetical protein
MKWRRGRGAWGVAALTMLAAMVAGGEARAGLTVPVITTQQIGDPIYEYLIDAVLQAGSTLSPGGFFTIYDLPSVPFDALAQGPNLFWGASIQPLGINPAHLNGPPPVDDPTIENVTFQWNGASPIMAGSSDLDLGIFRVAPTVELTSPPSGTVIYLSTLDGVNESNRGTVTINAVPEPTSIILMATAAVFVPFVYARGRRHRAAAPSA